MSKDLKDFEGVVDAKRQHKVDEALKKLTNDKTKLKAKYDDLFAEYQSLQKDFDFVSQFDLASIEPNPIKPLSKRSKKGEGFYLVNISDVHAMETVLPEQVNGLNEYDSAICRKSMENLWDGVGGWLQSHRSRINIPQVGVALLGDLITNMLHPDQKEMNSGTPQEEVLMMVDVILGGIGYLLDDCKVEKLYIFCSDGNHGRDDKKPQVANRSKHSYEWLMYHFIKRLCAEKYDDRVIFKISEAYLHYQDIFDMTLRMHHGDYIRYQGGVGGLTIPMNKAIAEWETGKHANLDVFGHWHTFINTGNFLSNGSVIGYSPYSIKIKAKYEQPMQTAVLFDKDRGITAVNRVYVR